MTGLEIAALVGTALGSAVAGGVATAAKLRKTSGNGGHHITADWVASVRRGVDAAWSAKGRLDVMDGEVERLKADAAGLGGKVEALGTELNGKLDGLEKQLHGIELALARSGLIVRAGGDRREIT